MEIKGKKREVEGKLFEKEWYEEEINSSRQR